MRRGTIVFVLFILIVAGIIGLSRVLDSQPPVQLSVVVSPLAFDWVSAAAERFNQTDPLSGTRKVRVVVTQVDDADGWDGRIWSESSHPDAWIPAWSASERFASAFPFTVDQPSLAKTVLVWGVFNTRMNAMQTDPPSPFGWDRVAQAAQLGRWAAIAPGGGLNGNLTLAFTQPTSTLSGFAVILSGAAAFYDTAALQTAQLSAAEFRQWLAPVLESVPNFNTLGASPARTIASRGRTAGEIALLPESDWVRSLSGVLADTADPIVLVYPDVPFVFDFPFAVWTGTTSSTVDVSNPDAQAVMRQFASFLASTSEQTAAQAAGLRPISGTVDATAALFSAAASYGVPAALDLSEPITVTTYSDVQRLITWANGIIR